MSWVFAAGLFTSEPVWTGAAIGGAAAIVSGAVGVFTVIRGQSFAGHSLADLSSAGGAAAFLLGIHPLLGFLGMGVLSAASMEALWVERASERDLATGVVTGAGLGVGALLLYLVATSGSTGGATAAVMFGSMFTIPPEIVPYAAFVAVVGLVAVGVLYRPLLLCSLDAELAAAMGIRVRLIGVLHLVVMALAVALSAITVGAVLSTALLIGPAAIALRVARRPGMAVLWAGAIGVAASWGGIVVAYDSYDWTGGRPWPVSFCIVGLIFAGYVASSVGTRRVPV